MVLGISLRRKKTKEQPPAIRPSPSLPNIAATGLSQNGWPEQLVDIQSLQDSEIHEAVVISPSKTEEFGHRAPRFGPFEGMRAVPFFHKPFRPAASSDAGPTSTPGRNSIASMFSTPHPPSAFNPRGGPTLSNKPSLRRLTRSPVTFNVMVAGAQGTGKTSLIRLLLDTCDLSPTSSPEHREALAKFNKASVIGSRTKSLKSVTVEVCEERYDRMLLTVIDTVGFDYGVGRELELERGVAGVMRYLDSKFADTMGEESKVIRQNKGDQHVHLCVYLIDPDTIMSQAARKAKLALPNGLASQTTLNRSASLSSITSEDTSDSSSSEDDGKAGQEAINGDEDSFLGPPKQKKKTSSTDDLAALSPAELRVIKRLSARCNILPVIAKSDTLTDERLAAVKKAVQRDLNSIGLDFGVFDTESSGSSPSKSDPKGKKAAGVKYQDSDDDLDDDEEEERSSRPVIKLRKPRRQNTGGSERSKSRQRRKLDMDDDDAIDGVNGEIGADGGEITAWPAMHSKSEVAAMLPFALISPEPPASAGQKEKKKNSKGKGKQINGDQASVREENVASPVPSTPSRRRPASMIKVRGPIDMKGLFTRRYRWGTIDVLDSKHCDFVAMRTAILGTHMKVCLVLLVPSTVF
ncbi:hypothetical protein FRC02_002141 [Tulasnella sp. 418]|nr:hypothetical protein FRC02_002141 [Tulasnella sp. 418]